MSKEGARTSSALEETGCEALTAFLTECERRDARRASGTPVPEKRGVPYRSPFSPRGEGSGDNPLGAALKLEALFFLDSGDVVWV